nr:hypothetical protein CFP56_16680 [Quercus suber]
MSAQRWIITSPARQWLFLVVAESWCMCVWYLLDVPRRWPRKHSPVACMQTPVCSAPCCRPASCQHLSLSQYRLARVRQVLEIRAVNVTDRHLSDASCAAESRPASDEKPRRPASGASDEPSRSGGVCLR